MNGSCDLRNQEISKVAPAASVKRKDMKTAELSATMEEMANKI